MKTNVLLGFVALFSINCATAKSYLKPLVMADNRPNIEVIVYGPDGTTMTHKVVINDKSRKTVYFDALYGDTSEASYYGGGIGFNEEDSYTMFRVDGLRRSAYKVRSSEKILRAPENVEIAKINVGGLKVGELSSVTKRIEWIVHPQLSATIPDLTYRANMKMSKWLRVMVQPRLGIGWRFHHYWDSTTYNLLILNDKGEKIKIPFTDDYGKDNFAANVAVNAHVGLTHLSLMWIMDREYKTQLVMQIGAIYF